ncbi:MAG: hypothetical protein ACYCT0_09465 [Sulfobacillus sp.]
MSLIETMRETHQNLLERLKTVGPGADETVNDAFMEDLRQHFALEEQEVYPIAQATGWTAGTAVTELLYQHQILRQQCLEASHDPKHWVMFCEQLSEHFAVEDLTVFSLVDQ